MTTREVFMLGMKQLGVAFNREIEGDVLDVYWSVLSAREPERLAFAFQRALSECKFFPPPSDLRAWSKPQRDEVGTTNDYLDELFRGQRRLGPVITAGVLDGRQPKDPS
jgi:hypothetical protein